MALEAASTTCAAKPAVKSRQARRAGQLAQLLLQSKHDHEARPSHPEFRAQKPRPKFRIFHNTDARCGARQAAEFIIV
jgi:hypothetical protein